MCIMEQFDKATFAQVPLRLTGDPTLPVAVRAEDLDKYRVGSGTIWRMGKKMLGAAIPERFAAGRPFPIVGHDVDALVIAHFVTLHNAG